jgi:hypothetical protein
MVRFVRGDIGITLIQASEVAPAANINSEEILCFAGASLSKRRLPIQSSSATGCRRFACQRHAGHRFALAASRTMKRRTTVNEIKHDVAHTDHIPLQEWAESTFGPFAPAYPTLRRWAMAGLIVPRPVKLGYAWFVASHAVYRDRLQVEHSPHTGELASLR